MAIPYHPRTGELLICRYPDIAVGAEMIKRRPCVVVSPRLRRRGNLCSVVPLSTTSPEPVENWHCQLHIIQKMPDAFPSQEPWAKCDMISTISLERLDRLQVGKRKYITICLSDQDIENIRTSVKAALGL